MNIGSDTMFYDVKELNPLKDLSESCIAIYDFNEIEIIHQKFEIRNLQEIIQNYSVRYEDHLTYETLCFSRDLKKEEKENAIFIFISKQQIHFIGNVEYLTHVFEKLKSGIGNRKASIGIIIHHFIMEINNEYTLKIDALIDELSTLEDDVLDEKKETKSPSKQILYYRKALLFYKRKYEQILNIFDSLLENNNDIYDTRELSRFNILKDRMNRMLSEISSLLEYVTEIREAYQSEVDNQQNKIMSLFTVITAIFLPLTLIAGWYGMNLKMPEYHEIYAYPIVIVVSILIVIFCIYYFKKKKWF